MEADKAFHDREPEPGAFVAALICLAGLEEGITNALEIVGCNADAGVADAKHQPRALHACSRDHRAAAFGELDRVGNKVEHDLLERTRIARHDGQIVRRVGARSTPPSRAFSASRLQQLTSAARGANGSAEISKLPDSIFDMSRMPLTTDNRCWPESLMSCAYSLRRAASSISECSCTIISEKPMIAFSGVRSSWLMVARKRVLAASAASVALRANSSACSCILRSVTSRITATTSDPDPPGSWETCSSGRQRISTQMKSTVPAARSPRGRLRFSRNSTLRASPMRAASESAVR